MYVFPSTSYSLAPLALWMNRGCPPTDRKARTGLLTPPGISCCASSKSLIERVIFIMGAHPTMWKVSGQESGRCEDDLPRIASSGVKKCYKRIRSLADLIQCIRAMSKQNDQFLGDSDARSRSSNPA